MTTNPVLVGIDGGGTHTSIGFSTDGHQIQTSHHDRPGRVAAGAEADTATRLCTSLAEARQAAGIDAPLGTVVLGLAGAGSAPVAEALFEHLARDLDTRALHIVTDAEIAFADAFPDGRGILLSAGTGSIAIGSGGTDDRMGRTGGHGWRFGDDGSGFAVGRSALNAVLKARDGRGPTTSLTEYVDPTEFSGAPEPRRVAALTEVVARCFEAGDAVARNIVAQAVTDLADHVESLDAQLPGSLPIAFNGGLLDERLPFRGLLAPEIQRRGIQGPVLNTRVDPVRGAIRLAGRFRTAS